MTSLLGLCVLFYYGVNNNAFITKHRSADNKGADVVSIVEPHLAEKTLPTVLPSMNEDVWFIDHGDGGFVDVDHATDQAAVRMDVHLDPDADPAMFYTTQLTHQKNAGVFLDVDGEPSDQVSSKIVPSKKVGAFLDADDNSVDSYFIVGDELKDVNTGKSIDPDG